MTVLLENKGEVGSLKDIQNWAMGMFSVSSLPSQCQTYEIKRPQRQPQRHGFETFSIPECSDRAIMCKTCD